MGLRGAATTGLGTPPTREYPEPVDLLERGQQLAVLRAALDAACAGEGSGVAVTGDSGAGKTALLDAVLDTASPDVRLLRGGCDPLRTPRPLGPFRDTADVTGLGALLRGEDISLSQVCEQMYDALATRPTALVLEDLHWVDDASVEVLRFLARRVGSMPLALLVSYREHEVGARHPLRALLGDVARLDGLRTVHLPPLSVGGVAQLVRGTPLEASAVHAVTGGNPFFVTEVANDPDRPLPTSVRDAVLARTVDVAPADYEVLQLVATAPDRLDDRVLPALGVDLPTLRRLDDTGLLARARGGLVFRHELARQAVESTIPPGGGPRLHARLLEVLSRLEPVEPAVLTHHAVAAGDAASAARHARAAAAEAARAGSHSEAAAFYLTALEHLDDTAAERAELLHLLSFEQYMTSRLVDAIDNVRATFPLFLQGGDLAGLSTAYQTCAIYEYYNARRHQAEAYAAKAESVAESPGREQVYGAVRTTRAFLAYLRNEFDVATQYCSDAGRIAEDHHDELLALRSGLVQAGSDLAQGDLAARGRMLEHIERARDHAWDELASTGYSQLAVLDVEQRRFRAAEGVLDESLPFARERDIPICRHMQSSVRARLHFEQGRWSAALEDAGTVLEEEGMPLALLWPHLITALVPLRRGSEDRPVADLEAAWQLSEQIDEPLRRLPVLSALAELMWMTAAADPRVTELAVAEVARLGSDTGVAWAVGDLAVWLHRLGLLVERPSAVAAPFRAVLEGRHEEAAAWWQQIGDPFASAMVLVDSPAPGSRSRGVELLDQLGAGATADRQRVALRQDGITRVPPRPRVSTRANPAGLTNRQLDVARLVARGLTNNEIATRLFISPKTADHHVSAVLGKLGLPNRRAVVVQASDLGLV